MNKRDKALLRRVRARVLRTDWTKGTYHRPKKTYGNWGGSPDKDTYCFVGLINDEVGLPPAGRFGVAGPRDAKECEKQLAKDKRSKRIQQLLLDATVAAGLRKRKPETLEAFNDASKTKREHIVQVLDYVLGEDE